MGGTNFRLIVCVCVCVCERERERERERDDIPYYIFSSFSTNLLIKKVFPQIHLNIFTLAMHILFLIFQHVLPLSVAGVICPIEFSTT